MRKLWVLGASALLLSFSVIDEASAQRRGGVGAGFSGGGARGVAVGGGYRGGTMGYRGGAVGYRGGAVGYRGGAIGYRGNAVGYRRGAVGYRGGAVATRRYVGPRVRGGYRWAGRRAVYVRPGIAGRRVVRGWGGRRVWVGRPGWRRNWWGWGWPIAAGVAVGAYGYGDACLRWDGYQWINVCYQPYYYGGYPYGTW